MLVGAGVIAWLALFPDLVDVGVRETFCRLLRFVSSGAMEFYYPKTRVNLKAMFSRPALVVFGIAVVEFFLFVYLANTVGAVSITLLALLLSIGGLYHLVRFAPRALRRGFKQLFDSGGDVSTKEAGDQAAQVVAGLMLATPGILTGVGGLLLLIKPIRNLLSPMIGAHVVQYIPTGPIQSITSFGRRGRGNIVDVDVVDVDNYSSKTKPTSSNPPELL